MIKMTKNGSLVALKAGSPKGRCQSLTPSSLPVSDDPRYGSFSPIPALYAYCPLFHSFYNIHLVKRHTASPERLLTELLNLIISIKDPFFFKCDLSLRTRACLPGMLNAVLAICLDHWCSIQACAANAHWCSEINISMFPIYIWSWYSACDAEFRGTQIFSVVYTVFHNVLLLTCLLSIFPGCPDLLIVISWISSSRN